MEQVRIGIIGAGFAAGFHAASYRTVPAATVVAIASRTLEKAQDLASRQGIATVHADVDEMLARDDIDIIDICTPVYAHADYIIAAARAGKHVVCEKPLTAYCGRKLDETVQVGAAVTRAEMYERAISLCDDIDRAVAANGVKLMYAENWVYAPAVQKARRLIERAGGTIFFMRGEESHSGSHSPYAKQWRYSGGGALIRLGSHPIGGVLYLKAVEGMVKQGRPYEVVSVSAEVANVTQIDSFQREDPKWVVTGWEDVEDWSCLNLAFEDGSRATIFASDIVLGGIQNKLDIYMSNARIRCNLNPNDACVAYSPHDSVFEGEYIAEKLSNSAGYQFPSVDEDFLSGYPHEAADFVQAVLEDRAPLSDGRLARQVMEVIYAGYLSAERGERVQLR